MAAESHPFPHYFEHTVGSCHATLALRADWQKQLVRCHEELGFGHVRFHGLLSDDVGTLVCEKDELVYSFFNADQIIDFLLSIGMRPFIELSFMPTTLSSGDAIVFHYKGNITPPKDFGKWEIFIRKLVQHWKDRYGASEVAEWFFEVWNEPNLSAFWTGTQAEYFSLYEHTARAIKGVDSSFRVGGPATAANAWITEFLTHCEAVKAPVDFVTTHHYPTDAFGEPGDDTISQLAQSRRSILREEALGTRSRAGNKPVYYTEWCTSSNPFDDLHDEPYAAAFIVKTVMEGRGIVDGYSYWTFSDIFEENYFSSEPFHGGFGLLSIYGVPKPAYRAFELLHRAGDEILNTLGGHETVDCWVTRRNGLVMILVTNWALPRHPIAIETIRIELSHVSVRSAHLERIDEDHANARRGWIEMGAPSSLMPNQVEALEARSALTRVPMPFDAHGDSAVFSLTLPPQGTAMLTLDTA